MAAQGSKDCGGFNLFTERRQPLQKPCDVLGSSHPRTSPPSPAVVLASSPSASLRLVLVSHHLLFSISPVHHRQQVIKHDHPSNAPSASTPETPSELQKHNALLIQTFTSASVIFSFVPSVTTKPTCHCRQCYLPLCPFKLSLTEARPLF